MSGGVTKYQRRKVKYIHQWKSEHNTNTTSVSRHLFQRSQYSFFCWLQLHLLPTMQYIRKVQLYVAGWIQLLICISTSSVLYCSCSAPSVGFTPCWMKGLSCGLNASTFPKNGQTCTFAKHSTFLLFLTLPCLNSSLNFYSVESNTCASRHLALLFSMCRGNACMEQFQVF